MIVQLHYVPNDAISPDSTPLDDVVHQPFPFKMKFFTTILLLAVVGSFGFACASDVNQVHNGEF